MIHLENVTMDTLREFAALSVHDFQNKFVSASTISLGEAYIHNLGEVCKAQIKAIYNDNDMIGHALIQYTPNGDESFYDFHRFMIDKRYQGQGYGKKAFTVVMDYIKTMPFGEASKVILEYMPGNDVASHIYHAYGFVDTDEYNKYGEVKTKLSLEI